MSQTTRRGYAVGAVAVVAAFALAYVLVYATSIATVQNSMLADLAGAFGEDRPVWKLVGWVFFNAQFVTTTVTVDVPIFGGTSAVNFIAETDALSPVLYVVPPALLAAAGVATARADGATDLGRALRVGPSVALGYLPLSVLGAFLFSISVGESSGGFPTLVTAVVLAGVIYPVVFGGLGAAVTAQLRE
jgi:hypothetical protein